MTASATTPKATPRDALETASELSTAICLVTTWPEMARFVQRCIGAIRALEELRRVEGHACADLRRRIRLLEQSLESERGRGDAPGRRVA